MTAEKIIAEILVDEAFNFMASKANVSVDEVKSYIASSDEWQKYFMSLINYACANIDTLLPARQ
jgi:hypothetical protein